MSYLSEYQLRQSGGSSTNCAAAQRALKSLPSIANTTIFLSHSHKDRVLAEGLRNYLADLGISLYIDWQDSDMPDKPSRETAEKLKRRINDMKVFLVLCTDNAINSRWVPWEIGVADSFKKPDKILIAPVANSYGSFAGSEYLQLYKRIEIASDGKMAIFEPNKAQGIYAKDWLSQI